jgi:hypothetical protein
MFLNKNDSDVPITIPISPIFNRHRVGTIIGISSESLSASLRNDYRHRSESTLATGACIAVLRAIHDLFYDLGSWVDGDDSPPRAQGVNTAIGGALRDLVGGAVPRV